MGAIMYENEAWGGYTPLRWRWRWGGVNRGHAHMDHYCAHFVGVNLPQAFLQYMTEVG